MTLALHVKGNRMNVQLVATLATVLIVATSGGCSGMRNFLFGRGAACGICPNQGPAYGVPGPELGCGMEPGCGYEPGCGHELGCGYETPGAHRPFAGVRRGCGLFGGGLCNGSSSCNCGSRGLTPSANPYGAFSGVVNDPYGFGGEVIGSEMIGGPYNGYPSVVYPGTVVDDNFDSRDSRIIRGESVRPVPTPGN
jgi:hypothetical protein